MITERCIAIIADIVRYYVMNRLQIQRRRFKDDKTGRITRRRLQHLVSGGFINRQRTLFCHPSASPAPIYYPAMRVRITGRTVRRRAVSTNPDDRAIPHHTMHWLRVTETHLALDDAIALQADVKIEEWANEWDIVNRDESAPEKRFRLYTLLRESPRLACAPDAAFLLSAFGHSKIFYLEQDRATSGVRQVSNGKTPGYANLAERNLHSRHFKSTVPEFSVLLIAPSERRRDALKAAIADKPGSHLWRFATESDITPERVLFQPVWFTCGKDEPGPLVKKGASS